MPCTVKLGSFATNIVAKTNVYMDAEKQLESFIDEKELLIFYQELLITKILPQTPECLTPQITCDQMTTWRRISMSAFL